jgi:pimeloyl-ACP methyl ester carboxylesterase
MRRALSTFAILAAVLTGRAEAGEADFPADIADRFAAPYSKRYATTVQVETTTQPVCGQVLTAKAQPIRGDGNYPMILQHGRKTSDAIVLVHGLSDSPYFVCAIARRFHAAGVNVVLPLLTGHGLKDPEPEIHLDHLEERWIEDVREAALLAQDLGERVSIGGLSTGGTLSVYTAASAPELVDGGVFLFSAALDFATPGKVAAFAADLPPGLSSIQLLEWLSGQSYRRIADGLRSKEMAETIPINNPYRSWWSDYAAFHLGLLRRKTLALLDEKGMTQPLFIRHSADDGTAFPSGVRDLAQRQTRAGRTVDFHELTRRADANCRPYTSSRCEDLVQPPPLNCGIQHASLVLEQPLFLHGAASGQVCEPANPLFAGMVADALAFHEEQVRTR